MRKYTVTVNEKVEEYDGFDANPSGADFELLPEGRIRNVEGAFWCSENELATAVRELARYEYDQFGRTRTSVKVIVL